MIQVHFRVALEDASLSTLRKKVLDDIRLVILCSTDDFQSYVESTRFFTSKEYFDLLLKEDLPIKKTKVVWNGSEFFVYGEVTTPGVTVRKLLKEQWLKQLD